MDKLFEYESAQKVRPYSNLICRPANFRKFSCPAPGPGPPAAAPAGAALQQTLQVPKFNGHRVVLFHATVSRSLGPGAAAHFYFFLIEIYLFIRSFENFGLVDTSSRQARGAPAPHPEFFKIFHAARRKGAAAPPGVGAFSSHRFRTRGSAFLISRYSYLLIEASEFFLKLTNLHEIILIFIKL